tara:strand:+ start:2029 stop:2262 length:234 start_codon:yes stop_codon:yes gene_type:complete
MKKRTATIEILGKGEKVLGSPTNGEYMVRMFEEGIEMSGSFYKTIVEADKAVRDWERKKIETPEERVERWERTLSES